MLVKIKYANIVNIAAREEIIPELLQSKCNPENIFKVVSNLLDRPLKIQEQVKKTQNILNQFKTNKSSAVSASKAINIRL
jgi:lipid A disaccharide synthetase